MRIPLKTARSSFFGLLLLFIAFRLEAGINLVTSFSKGIVELSPFFGYSVSSAGDVNGDGYSDMIVGAYGAGSAYLYFGYQPMYEGQYNINPNVVLTGQPSEWFGYSVSGAGDVNQDGYDDVIIGAVYNDAKYQGHAYLYFGGSSMDSSPDLVLTGENSNCQFGNSVSDAGDVNHDGYDDVLVGERESTGAAYIYFGGASMDAVADVVIRGSAYLDWAGSAVSSAGDVNNDGYDDVIVGMSGFSSNPERACIYLGGAGMDNAADVVMKIANDETWNFFARSVSKAGDVNGDGFDDVIIGAENIDSHTGRAYLYFGGSTMDSTADIILTGQAVNDYFGHSVSDAGDMNGDGYGDVIIGAYGYNQSTGRVFVFYGGPDMDNTADLVMTGEDRWNYFGVSVSGAGDVNNDGLDDCLVGASKAYSSVGRSYNYNGGRTSYDYANNRMTGFSIYNFGAKVKSAGDVNDDGYDDFIVVEYILFTSTGRVFIYFGGDGLDQDPDLVLEEGGTSDQYGGSVSAAGDVNGDGYDDVIVGAFAYNGDRGRAYIYLGGAAMDNMADVILTGDGVYKEYAHSVSTAGDVNGDGYDDVIVGAHNYFIPGLSGRSFIYFGGGFMDNAPDLILSGEGTQNDFGVSVSTAGDVNGDGYGDVIVGSMTYDGNRGRAYVFYGGSPMNNLIDVILNGTGAEYDYFGLSVISAGDVNHDGYDDVAVSEKNHFHFFFGGPAMDNTEDLNLAGGYSAVASAGDVNNDGYDDVLVGASGSSSFPGWAYIYYGGQFMDKIADITITGECEGDNFGACVSAAGDVNGDGITEWIVSATAGGVGRSGKIYMYRLSSRARAHAWLEGPYQPEGSMLKSLFDIGAIPLTSPYSDGRRVSAVPNGAVDWVQLELRASAAGPALSTKSVFINTGGNLVEPDGTTTDVTLPALDGSYYLIFRHRNHLAAMSASALTFSNSPAALYDFSSGLGQCYGTDPNRAVQLNSGVYGMAAGDADGSGTIDASDRSAAWNERNQIGYSGADCNLSGTVDASDRSITWNNRNKSTSVP